MPIELNPPYWTGGPPYPQFPTDDGKFGLSILDWFAGHAVAGLMGSELINQNFFDQFIFPGEQNDQFITPAEPLPSLKKASSKETPDGKAPPGQAVPPTPEQLAMIAYAIAGTMVEIRKSLPIESKPVPTTPEPTSEIPIVMPPAEMGTAGTVTVGSSVPPPNTFVTLGTSNAPTNLPETP